MSCVFNSSSDDNLVNNQKSAFKFKKDFKEKLEFPNSIQKSHLEYQKSCLIKRNSKELFSELRKSFLLRRESNEKFSDADRFNYKCINDKMSLIDQNVLILKFSSNEYSNLINLLNSLESTRCLVETFLKQWTAKKIIAAKDGLSYQSYLLSIIQEWFESLFYYLNQIEVFTENHPLDNFIKENEINKQMNLLYKALIESSFVIEVEPSQVIRSETK